MVSGRSQFKCCVRKCKFDYDNLQTSKLIEARHKHAKLYWNMLKRSAHVKQPNVPLSTLEHYSKSVNNSDDTLFTPDEDSLHFVDRYEKYEFDVMFQELNIPTEHDSLLKAIKQLNTNKSGGPDMFIN